MTGPFHSSRAGIANPTVLPHPDGPITARLAPVSAATSRSPDVAESDPPGGRGGDLKAPESGGHAGVGVYAEGSAPGPALRCESTPADGSHRGNDTDRQREGCPVGDWTGKGSAERSRPGGRWVAQMVGQSAEGNEGVVDLGGERWGPEESHRHTGGPEEPERGGGRCHDAGNEETFEEVSGAPVVGGHELPLLGRRSES